MSISGSEFTDITCINSSGDLTSSQYYIVMSTAVDTTYSAGNLTCKICTGASGGTAVAKGVLQNDPDTGQVAIVRVDGLTKVVAGEAIAVNNLIASSTAGTAVVVDTSGQWYIGRAESATTASGGIITARLFGCAAFYAGAGSTA